MATKKASAAAGRRNQKLVAADSAKSAGSLATLAAAAPIDVPMADDEPTAAAMMMGGLNASVKASVKVSQGGVSASVTATIGMSGGMPAGSLGSGAKSGSSPRDGDPDVGYAFQVTIGSIAYAMFNEIGGLSWKAEAIPVRSGGNNEHSYNMRGPGKFEPLTMKRGWFASNGEFYDMMKASLSGSSLVGGAGAKRSNITITVLNRKYQPIGEYQIFNAFITEYSGLSLNAMSSQVGFEQIRMVYDYFVYKAM
ncbi:MAG: phage tail protein [Deltaproteobacteria bacterium]|nr:phage tail protein [Deltaproteobacteria bacterium]